METKPGEKFPNADAGAYFHGGCSFKGMVEVGR